MICLASATFLDKKISRTKDETTLWGRLLPALCNTSTSLSQGRGRGLFHAWWGKWQRYSRRPTEIAAVACWLSGREKQRELEVKVLFAVNSLDIKPDWKTASYFSEMASDHSSIVSVTTFASAKALTFEARWQRGSKNSTEPAGPRAGSPGQTPRRGSGLRTRLRTAFRCTAAAAGSPAPPWGRPRIPGGGERDLATPATVGTCSVPLFHWGMRRWSYGVSFAFRLGYSICALYGLLAELHTDLSPWRVYMLCW